MKVQKLLMIYTSLLIITTIVALTLQSPLTPEDLKFQQKIKQILDSHLVQGIKWNMTFHFYMPDAIKYGPAQWLWDSGFHMIAWSRINVTNSILDLRTMLKKQKKNFRIPQMIYWGPVQLKFKLKDYLLNSDPTCTDITQMPMLAMSLQRMYNETKDKQILHQFLPKLVQYYEWWAKERQPDHDGLVVIIHPWESGLDASPMYDEALVVEDPQPTYSQMYPHFEQLIISYRFKYNWNQNRIISNKNHSNNKVFSEYFVMKQVGVNAIYTIGWKILGKLALEIGNQALAYYCSKQYKHFLKGVQSLFDEDKNRYVSRYLHGSEYKPTRADTVQSLFPLLLQQIHFSHQRAILEALQDQKRYKSKFPIPTVSQSDPAFNPIFTIDLMWRGPSWAAPNYFILYALATLPQTDQIEKLFVEIASKWINQAKQHGIWEMWNHETGQGYGVKQIGMSTCVLDMLYRLRILQQQSRNKQIDQK